MFSRGHIRTTWLHFSCFYSQPCCGRNPGTARGLIHHATIWQICIKADCPPWCLYRPFWPWPPSSIEKDVLKWKVKRERSKIHGWKWHVGKGRGSCSSHLPLRMSWEDFAPLTLPAKGPVEDQEVRQCWCRSEAQPLILSGPWVEDTKKWGRVGQRAPLFFLQIMVNPSTSVSLPFLLYYPIGLQCWDGHW